MRDSGVDKAAGTIVVGGGIAGLACAHAIARAGGEVVLLEAGPRAGGVVRTRRGAEFQFEEGPNTVQAGSAAFRELVDELGLSNRLVSSPGDAVRWLWHRGKLVPLPSKPQQLLTTPLLSLGGKLRVLSEPLRRWTPPAPGEPEPDLLAFLSDRVGREVALRFAGAFVRGVYGAEIGSLGARSAFPRLWEAAARSGSLLKAAKALAAAPRDPLPGPQLPRTALVSFPSGLEELVEALVRALGHRMRLSSSVERIAREHGQWRVELARDMVLRARQLVLACPAQETARLLAGSLSEGLRRRLAGVPHASLTVAHLGFEPGAVPVGAASGFGFLVPPDAAQQGPSAPVALGAIFTSDLFPGRAPRGARSFSCFLPQGWSDSRDDADLVRDAAQDLARSLGLASTPRVRESFVRRWHNVIPTYGVGHMELVASIRAELAAQGAPVHLAGSWTDGISVDLSIASGREAARRVLAEEARA